jgi:hypothetical protein
MLVDWVVVIVGLLRLIYASLLHKFPHTPPLRRGLALSYWPNAHLCYLPILRPFSLYSDKESVTAHCTALQNLLLYGRNAGQNHLWLFSLLHLLGASLGIAFVKHLRYLCTSIELYPRANAK